MELVDIDIVALEKTEAGVELFPEAFDGGGHGFRGNDDVFADVVEGDAEFFFTVTVSAGGIEVIDAVVVGFPKDTAGFGHRGTLNGKCAEAVEVDGQAGAPETDGFHGSDLVSVNLRKSEKGHGIPLPFR